MILPFTQHSNKMKRFLLISSVNVKVINSVITLLLSSVIGVTEMTENPSKMRYKDVYHSLESVLSVFNRDEYKHLPEVAELMHIYSDYMKKVKEKESERNAFVVIEGLDASGKTTLSKMLAKKMLGVRLSTPPDCLVKMREKFDKHNSTLRRAFYALGNYIAAEEVRDISTIKHVVLDRYWHSTAAYAIATEVTEGGNILPPPDSPVYSFPSDLLEPDFVFFLTVTEENRLKRIAHRTGVTPEEDKLKKEKLFRDTMAQALKRMLMPPMFIEINANVNAEGVLIRIWDHILTYGQLIL